MDSFKIIGYSTDFRTNTNVVYAQIGILDYLALVGLDFDKFEIQRKKESHTGYARLKKDIKDGALIPPITLALEPSQVKKFVPLIRGRQTDSIQELILKNASVYILDGLQRTHIMKEIKEEGGKFKKEQRLLLEFWFEEEMGNLIYRLIVLNSGQKPMSMRHQIELLFVTMQEKLKVDIKGLIMYNEREKKVRENAKQFPFDRIVTGYHCFLKQSPDIDKSHIIVKNLDAGRIITEQELVILEKYDDYVKYLREYIKIDNEAYRVYGKFKGFPSAKNWLAEENVVNSFFAAIGFLYDVPEYKKRIDKALKGLFETLKKAKVGDDPFALVDFNQIRINFDPREFNVGYITRKTMMDCFLEYLKGEGLISFKKCWSLVDRIKAGRSK